jgi:single-strand DNA-binding protein
MNHAAEFDILGRVNAAEKIGSTTKVTIVSNCRRQGKDGKWVEAPHWNTVTIFAQHIQDYVVASLKKGDEVRARGDIANAKYANAKGETVYTVNLICNDISIGARATDNTDRD